LIRPTERGFEFIIGLEGASAVERMEIRPRSGIDGEWMTVKRAKRVDPIENRGKMRRRRSTEEACLGLERAFKTALFLLPSFVARTHTRTLIIAAVSKLGLFTYRVGVEVSVLICKDLLNVIRRG